MKGPPLALALLLAAAIEASAQTAISGIVRDIRGDALTEAEVQVQSESTGARWKTQSDDNGRYSVSGLPASRYKVTVRLPGFRTVARGGVVLEPGSDLSLDFTLDLLGLHQVITVVNRKEDLDPSSGDSLLMTRASPGALLPANGRDMRSSFDLMPGVVVTPASVSDAGQFTSNGQRPNSSAYRVDGLSANTGVGGSALPGSFPGASLPAMTAFGSTENLASPDTAQSVEFQTSAFAPEAGERPGAEVLVNTRAGSNDFHGEFFGRVRDNGWTARDWFANSRDLPFERPYYRNLGGVFGGPVIPNRTFVFLSADQSQVHIGGLELTSVPSLTARQNAPASLQYVLNEFPSPTGPDSGDGTAEGDLVLSRTAALTTYTARIDQALGSRGNLFARMVHSPSSSEAQTFDLSSGKSGWISGSVGTTLGQSAGTVHDFRFNYSRARFSTHLSDLYAPVFDLAGLAAPNVPAGFDVAFNADTVRGLTIPGLGQFVGGVMGSPRQDQWEFRYTMSREIGRHRIHAGADAIRLEASRDAPGASILGVASSLQGLLARAPTAVTYSSIPQFGDPVYTASVWVQDTWRAGDRLTILYGLRWEFTPPAPSASPLSAVSGLWTGQTWQSLQSGDVYGTAPWPMRYSQAAPRVAVAYRTEGTGIVLRAGAGTFFDNTLGASTSPINGAPFNSWLVSSDTGGTVSAPGASNPASSFPPGSGAADVQQFVAGQVPALRLPASYQWRVSAERAILSDGVASATYVGTLGRNLLGNAAYIQPDSGILTRFITWTRNPSNYQALQLRYTGSIGRGATASAAYTYSHSIDDGSEDSSVFLIHPDYALGEARGSSSFDVRHALTAAISYRMPRSSSLGRLPVGLADWTISGILRARGGFPIDVLTGPQGLGRGFDNAGRPNLAPGVPLWIADPTVAGNRRLNPAAFTAPPAGTLGNLGRNAFSGNGLAQWDMSLHREFPIYGRASLDVSVSVFNVFNHPAFADPVPYLSSPWFGQSTSMQNLMLGSGTANTGLPPLFQTGGPRTGEFSFRISF